MYFNTKHTMTSIVVAVVATLGSVVMVLSFPGCVAEPAMECSPRRGHRLTFRYTYNSTLEDMIAASVRSIRVYVFGRPGDILCRILEVGPRDISRGWFEVEGLPPGTYTFVAWGCGGEDLSRSFVGRHIADTSLHTHTGVEIGTTSLVDLYMMLDPKSSPPVESWSELQSESSFIEPATSVFDDLFHAVARDVRLSESADTVVPFDFVRNTSVIKVSVTGIGYLSSVTRAGESQPPLEIFATGENGRYGWDNSIDPHAPAMLYRSSNLHLTDHSLSLDVPMMRMHITRHADAPVLLHLRSVASGAPVMNPIDILAGIQKIRDTSGELRYPDQSAIDREDEFRVNIAFEPDGKPGDPYRPDDPGNQTGIRVTITINEWRIETLLPEIDIP